MAGHMTASDAKIVLLAEQYVRLGYRLTLLEIQKLAYFLQEAGEPLRLNYQAGLYGPYAHNLNKVLERIEGHFIRGYGDSQKPDVETLAWLLLHVKTVSLGQTSKFPLGMMLEFLQRTRHSNLKANSRIAQARQVAIDGILSIVGAVESPVNGGISLQEALTSNEIEALSDKVLLPQ